MAVDRERAINQAAILGMRLEHLVYNKAKEGKLVVVAKDADLVMAYWSLIFDLCKGPGCLLHNKFYSPAFALLRPIMEALVRACVVLVGMPEEVTRIRQDDFRVNFKTDGARADEALGTGTLIQRYLEETRGLLHSLTHGGTAQLGMQFDGKDVGVNATDGQVMMLLGACSNASFFMTILVAKHFRLEDVALAANDIFLEYGKENAAVLAQEVKRMDLKAEIEQTRKTCEELEQLVFKRQPLALDERKALLVAHWNLIIDFHMSITSLLLQNLCGGAFGLMRPLTEAWLRAHLVVSANENVYQAIKDDTYRTNFAEVPKQIDEAFGLQFFGKNLSPEVVSALHSYTHSGGMQIARRFKGLNFESSFSDEEKWRLAYISTLALSMTTILVTKTLGFDEEFATANKIFLDHLKKPE